MTGKPQYVDGLVRIGPTALYAAQAAKHTYAFEPDPVAYEELEVNTRANAEAAWASRLTIHNKAVVPAGNKLRLGSRTSGGEGGEYELIPSLTTAFRKYFQPRCRIVASPLVWDLRT